MTPPPSVPWPSISWCDSKKNLIFILANITRYSNSGNITRYSNSANITRYWSVLHKMVYFVVLFWLQLQLFLLAESNKSLLLLLTLKGFCLTLRSTVTISTSETKVKLKKKNWKTEMTGSLLLWILGPGSRNIRKSGIYYLYYLFTIIFIIWKYCKLKAILFIENTLK